MSIIGILLLATLIEGTITYIWGESSDTPRPALRYISLALGIVVAVAYKIDIPAIVGLASEYSVVGYIVSGLIIGRGANYINDIFKLIQKPS
jgi:hydrogenase/urease accessory protein HupE